MAKLTKPTMRALELLAQRGPITPGAFADAMGYRGGRRHGQLGARVLEGLKRRGLVRGFAPPGSIWHYTLTDLGRAAQREEG